MSAPCQRLRTLDDLPNEAVSSRPVFVRVDFNVPLSDGAITDDTRVRSALPTIHELRGRGARVVLASHLGRPRGKRREELSLAPVAEALRGLLGAPVPFAADCIGQLAHETVAGLEPGGVCLLENLRFHAGEKANDEHFARQLAQLAETYVDDAFGTAHRAHASTAGVPALLSYRAAGRLLVREVENLRQLADDPQHPYVAVLGGAKVSSKIEVLERLVETVDALLLGGGIANTFLAAAGADMADSLVDRQQLEVARAVTARARERGVRLGLPSDLVVASDLDGSAAIEMVAAERVPEGKAAFDIGERTCEHYEAEIAQAGTVFWNGPMGVFEVAPFDGGTLAVARAVASSNAFTIAGGGETVAAINRAGCAEEVDHVSTGGGASLELVAGRVLPGIAVLETTEQEGAP